MTLFSDLGETIHDALQRVMVLVIAALVALYLYKRFPPAAEEKPVDLNSDELVDLPDEVDGLTGAERENQVLIISESDAQCTVETEIIEDEMQKQLRKCTCAIPLRMHRLGGGRYRMSNSSRLCLVRILRSTVMVRVGGGWVSLNEFLIKNDPCRVRLTNLGSNINGSFAQHMVHFKAKQPVR